MRKRLRVLGVAFVAVFAFCAIASAAAHAEPRWKVAGGFLGNGALKEFGSTSTNTAKLSTSSGITIHCNQTDASGSVVGSTTSVPGTLSGVNVTYTECTVESAPVCSVRGSTDAVGSGMITTASLKGTLVWLKKTKPALETEDEAGELLESEHRAPFAKLVFEGEECPLGGVEEEVKGSVIGKFLQKAGGEFTTGELEFTSPAITKYYTGETATRTEHTITGLKLGAATATYTGTQHVMLEPAETVGVYRG